MKIWDSVYLFQPKNPQICFQIGNTVGYQIRLESRVSPKTLLTFCTNGVLLRSLMGGEANALGTLTHVIVDEVKYRPFEYREHLDTKLFEVQIDFKWLV